MPIPPRIAIPVLSAIIVAGASGGFLFYQLDNTRALLTQELTATQTGTGTAEMIQAIPTDAPVDSGNAALLHLRKGDVLGVRGDWQEAQTEYQLSVDAGGGLTALRKLAQAQLQRRDVRGAQNTLDQLRREGAKSEDVLLLESIINIRTGELEKARTILQAANDSPQKHYGLALLAIVGADHMTAQTELAAVVNGWEPVLRSYARTMLTAYDEYTLFPESPQIHLLTLLSRSLAQVQECELALPLLSQVTRAQDDYRDAWIIQGFCELTSERPAEALASLERAYQIDPEKPETQYFLGRAYMEQGDHGNALTFLQYALQNGFEPAAEARRLIASEALQTGNIALALDQTDALTKLPNATIDAYSDYVSAAILSDKKQEAEVKAQEAVQKWPNAALAYDLLGWAQAENDKKDEAKKNLEKALQLNPNLESAKEHLKKL
jgi:tetratricopeptide (TPR) repeat protein